MKDQWYQFGMAIGVPKEVLLELFGYSEEDCLIEILDYWLKNHSDQPTWKELADGLEDIQDYELAKSIMKVYSVPGYQKKYKNVLLNSVYTVYDL